MMEKSKAEKEISQITKSLKKIDLSQNSSPKFTESTPTVNFHGKPGEKRRPPSLVSLCLGVVGQNLEDIVADLGEIAVGFPSNIKMAIAAIARRRKLLNDDVIISLADSSWEILDISGSDVTDSGLAKVAESCRFLRAVDISWCNKITAAGVSIVVQHCKSLQTMRCGGCPNSEYTAHSCLAVLKPKLNDMEGDSWEELDTAEIGQGAESLRWLVWPKINKESLDNLSSECPRIIVNPKPSLFGFRGIEVPTEAFPDTVLDDPIVKDVDPKTWAVRGFMLRPVSQVLPSPSEQSVAEKFRPVSQVLPSPSELSVAEKFRLAFAERDARLAPKRAKNARQHQRRAEREWMMTSTEAKAIALASKATKSLYTRK